MDLVLVRHAAAEKRDASTSDRDDALRPLTNVGREKMTRGARGLRALVPDVDLLATSPLLRARQTAEILAETYGGLRLVEIAELAPDAPREDVVHWLCAQSQGGTLLLVGHEPNLGELTAWLLGSAEPLAFKKGGACRLALPDDVGKGCATLVWQMAPSELRGV